jgi:thiopeptide-type bacteriocin biosynthesis protein
MRYWETEPELRIRVALDEVEEFGHAAAVLGRWTARLKTAGLASRVVLDTYLPETGRWGDGDALDAAEAVFHADSQAVAAHLRTGGKATRTALIAAGFAAIAAGFTGSTAAGMRWLIEHGRPSRPARRVDRALLTETNALVDARDYYVLLEAGLANPAVNQVWLQRSAALTAYRMSLGEHGGSGPDAVLTSLLHVHHIRAYALDGEHERLCLHLARASAQAFLHRNGGATP